MKKRRMLTPDLIESDSFYTLSSCSQALYVHLNLNADDDGVVDNWKSIVRIMKARKEHLDALCEKKYLLHLPNDTLYITHWRGHNQIRSDRYIPGLYKDELTQLIARAVISNANAKN